MLTSPAAINEAMIWVSRSSNASWCLTRAYAFHCGQQPQGQQHLRIRRRATRTVRYCFDVPIKSRQVQLVQEPPNSTGRMIFRYLGLQIYRSPLQLFPYRTQHPGVLRKRRRTNLLLFARRKFKQRGFAHGLPLRMSFPRCSESPLTIPHKDLFKGSESPDPIGEGSGTPFAGQRCSGDDGLDSSPRGGAQNDTCA